MLTPKEIGEKTFDKTFGFGYRMDDVDAFLEQAAKALDEQQKANAELEKKLEVLADKLTEYREDEESLRTALLGAQKLGDSVIRESKTKAEIVLRDATIKAEAMVSHAKRQIEQEQTNLERIQHEVASFKGGLLDMYKQHIELISSLPCGIANSAYDESEEAVKPVLPSAEIEPENDEEAAAQAFSENTAATDNEAEEESFAEPNDEELESYTKAPVSAFLDVEEDEEADADDADEEENARFEGKFSDMRFGEAFKIKRNEKPLFRK